MITQKQIEANKNNALLSSGAVTEEGKIIVSKNAVKHGIFAKDLIISNGLGKENKKEYQEILGNLVEDLKPRGQVEYLLIEKIAVDYWRLKRVLRFESGSINKHLEDILNNYYKNIDSNKEIKENIKDNKKYINWNNKYIECLNQGIVNFDNPTWTGAGLEADIEDDLYLVFESIKYDVLSNDELNYYKDENLNFENLTKLFKSKGLTKKDIINKLVFCLEKQNKKFEDLSLKISSLPTIENIEKIMKYEKSIQKSIMQNIILLKKLQGLI
ncbi:MAG: hypothetical protein GY817_00700 [bacterium]|nr:hypothetical protein [bacterium]